MNKEILYTIAEKMGEQMGEKNLLDELLGAMDYDELKANLEYIDRMNDLGIVEMAQLDDLQTDIYDSFIDLWGEEFHDEAYSMAQRAYDVISGRPLSGQDEAETWAALFNDHMRAQGFNGHYDASDFDSYVNAYTEVNGELYFFD